MTEQLPTIKALRVTMPSRSLDDPDRPYVRSYDTDLAESFRLAREQQRILQHEEREQLA